MPRALVHIATLACLAAAPLAAQNAATVSGVARGADGRPIAGAFVLALRDAEAVLDPVAGVLTDSAGRFVLRGLPTEPLVLRVRRLGWTLSAPTPVTPTLGTTVRDLVVESRALDLTPIRVVAAGACISRDGLADAPAVAAVWAAATDAVRVNQEIQKAFAIAVTAERTSRTGDDPTTVAIDTILPELPTAEARAPTPADELFGTVSRVGLRRRPRVSLLVRGPGMLTEEAFLRGYCVGNALEATDDGLVALTFAPQRSDPSRVEARGKILFDPDTRRFVGADYDFWHDGRRAGNTSLRIAYVEIGGTTVAMIDQNRIEFQDSDSGLPFFRETFVVRERRFSRWPTTVER